MVAHTAFALIPASAGEAPQAWLQQHQGVLRLANEMRMFGGIAVVSAALAWSRPSGSPIAFALGRGALALAGSVEVLIVIVEGRLAYPLPGFTLPADAITLLAALEYGAVHAADILFAVAVGALTTDALHSGVSRTLPVILATATVVLLLIASFPWAVPAGVGIGAAVLLSCWAVFVPRRATALTSESPGPST